MAVRGGVGAGSGGAGVVLAAGLGPGLNESRPRSGERRSQRLHRLAPVCEVGRLVRPPQPELLSFVE